MFSLVGQIAAHEGAVRSMACKVDGSVLFTGGSDAFVRVWDILTGELMSTISHDHCVTAILVDDEHHYVITGCMDTNIRIFDFKYEEVNRLAGHTKGVISLTRHENILVSGSWDGTAMLWDLQTFQCYRKLEGMENGINVLASADRLITTSTGEAVNNKPCNFRIRIWDMTDGSLLREPIEDHDASIRSVAAVPHLGFVTSSNDGTVRLFTTEGKNEILIM
jgi:phospholipase A-2-activating protein